MSNINIEKLKQIFQYSENSPSGLIYKAKIPNKKIKIGDVAGKICSKKDGKYLFWKVWLDGRPFTASRVILLLQGFDLSDKIVDHFDGNPLNNKLNNLRVCDYVVNNRNKTKSKNNKTGVTGVFLETLINPHGKIYRYYVSSYTDVKNLPIKKRFSINKLGDSEAFKQALIFREYGIKSTSHYTERHGND